ncbi:DUF4352 domain-containing protein [Salinibacillus xinjiangensis]|uniref:DUF4352 domain-containing protein n=1 Tax=Salinibacillus xinjiangensis TaxID=1229268 RepID=A0A6G1X558_9BACI|nr:DUF4352 domain-containing protein [Salinibacillus xinjiangensis]MRG86036.1 DUF4352 domain-containing protein [Salinibacillus xinjiangensis]
MYRKIVAFMFTISALAIGYLIFSIVSDAKVIQEIRQKEAIENKVYQPQPIPEVTNKESTTFHSIPSEEQFQKMLHEISHQKVSAADKQGHFHLPISDKVVDQLTYILDNKKNFEHHDTYRKIVADMKWEVDKNWVDYHNSLNEWLGYPDDNATGIMTDSEQNAYINEFVNDNSYGTKEETTNKKFKGNFTNAESQVLSIGDTVQFEEMKVKLRTVSYVNGNEFTRPQHDDFVTLLVTIKNTSNKVINIHPVAQMDLFDSESYKQPHTYMLKGNDSLHQVLKPEQKIYGKVIFDAHDSEFYQFVMEDVIHRTQAVWHIPNDEIYPK